MPPRMDRRDFLSASLVTAAAATVGGVPTRATAQRADETGVDAVTGQPAAFPFAELSVVALQSRMTTGALTSRALTAAYLARIDAVDRAGPLLNSVIETNPDALAIADARDAERRAGTVRGPLHGIPVLIKDNIDSADQMQTTAGSLALVGRPALRDAFIVQRLRDAGAVLLGKTNLSEWANFRSTRSTSGWSGRGGESGRHRDWDGNRWFDHLSVVHLRTGWHQAHRGVVESQRYHSDFGVTGYGGPDGAHRG